MNLKKLSFFILLFLQFSTFKLFSEDVTFTAPQILFTSILEDPQITTDSSGRYVYAISEVSSTNNIIIFVSSDFGQTWIDVDPLRTIFGTGAKPQIATDSSGKYVYAFFSRGTPGPIKIYVSSDFGQTWTDTTPLSFGLGENDLQIATDSSGKNVYLIWADDFGNVTTFVSSDFGQTWTNTTDGSFGTTTTPQITTNSTGKNVYAIWPTGGAIKIFVSNDFGQTWTGTGSFSGSFPQITTDSTGQYVYAIFRDPDAQIFMSSDFGATWRQATDSFGAIALNPQITTDNSGRFVYAIWRDGNDRAKIFVSLDFGVTWINPFTSTGDGEKTQITTDSSGRYIYVIFNDFPSLNIKIFVSLDFGLTWEDIDTTDTFFGSGILPQIVTDSTGRNVYGIWESTNLPVTTGLRSFFPILRLSSSR